MPASFTHQSFGDDVLLKSSHATFIQKYQAYFDLGLQGPDLLFYYHPTTKNYINQKGSHMHEMIARHFFEEAINSADEASLAYLCGFSAHYILDHACHPYINKIVKEKHFGHFAIERELDMRMMSQRQAKEMAVAKGFVNTSEIDQRLGAILGVESIVMKRCIDSFKLLNGLIYNKHALIRDTLAFLTRLFKVGTFSEMFIMRTPDVAMILDIDELCSRYNQAIEEGVLAIDELLQKQKTHERLSSRFDFNYE